MTPELQKQIEQEAKDYAEKRHDDLGDKKNLHRKTLLRYAHQAGATQYASLLQAAEARAERYEKALKEIKKGLNWIENSRELDIIHDALTPKTSTDELHKES